MNRAEEIDLANVIGHIRPDWQQPGTIAALRKTDATYGALALHAIRVALDPASRTPAAINNTPTTPPTVASWHRPDYAAMRARTADIEHCDTCDSSGRINGILCDHDPNRSTRNAQARAAARAAIRPTIRHETEENL